MVGEDAATIGRDDDLRAWAMERLAALAKRTDAEAMVKVMVMVIKF